MWGATTWVKVTSEPASWEGEYLLVRETSATAGKAWTGIDNASCDVAVSISSSVISTKPDNASTITIASMTGGYSIKVNGGTNNGKFMYGASGSNIINFGTSAQLNTISYDGTNKCADIVSNTSHIRYNTRFRYYKSTTYTSQEIIQLYKKTTTSSEKYTVSFNTGTGNPAVPNRTETTAGGGITLPSTSDLTPTCSSDGWVLYGWATEAYGSATTTTAPTATLVGLAGTSYYPTANTTLYAVYRQFVSGPTTTTYTINSTTWGTNNGNWTKVDGSNLAEPASGKYGFSSNASSSATSPSAYSDISSIVFAGSKSKTGEGTVEFLYGYGSSWTTLGSKSINNSQTWTPSNVNGQLKIIFTRTAGNVYIASITVTYKTYNYFSNPSCCSSLGSINGSFSFTNVSPTSVTVGVPSDYSDKDDSDLTGYIFKRYTAATGGSAVETKETNTKSGTTATFNTNLAANTTYYYTITAKHSSSSCNSAETSPRKSHTIASYVVSYAAGGGSGTNPGAHPAVLSGTSVTLKANTFTAPAGKQFANWNDGTSSYNPNVSYTVTGSKTMTAQWSCITPTVTGPSSGASYTQGESADALEVSASGGTLSYQWKQCATVNGDYVNAVGGNGDKTASYTPPTSNVGTLYYKCVVTNTGSSCNTTATSTPVAVTISEPACTAPTAIAVSSEANTGATLTVTDDNNVNKYDFYCSTSSTKPANNATPTASVDGSKEKAITGLAYGTSYYYWARTDCGETKSPWYPDENPSTFTTTVPDPTSVAAGSLTLTGATLTITDNNSPAIGSYDIYYSTSSTAPEAGTTPSATTTSTSYDLTGLTSGQTYYFWVRGKGSDANSAWIGGDSFTALSYTAISIETAPTKTKYLVGDYFDPTGLVITRKYSDNSTDTYSYAGHTTEFSFSPATNAALTAENNKVTITWNGLTVDQAINVYTVTVNKVDMSVSPEAITDDGITAGCDGRTLSQSVGSTNYVFNSWQVVAGDVTISNNEISGTPSGNVTINAKFHTPLTVTWKVKGAPWTPYTTKTEGTDGSASAAYNTKVDHLPTAPEASDGCGDRFMGWTAEDNYSGDSAPGDLFTDVDGSPKITTNITFHAVFADYND